MGGGDQPHRARSLRGLARYHSGMIGPEASSGHLDRVRDVNLAVQLRRLLAVTRASFEQRAQLQRALNTRIVVEQAKGVLAERFQVTPEEALGLLRGAARSSRMQLREL